MSPEELDQHVVGRGEEVQARKNLRAATEHANKVTEQTKDYAQCAEQSKHELIDQTDRFGKAVNDLVADIRGNVHGG